MDKEEKKKLLETLPENLMSIKDKLGLTFPRLPLTEELGKALKKLDPGETDLLTGEKAGKAELLDRKLGNYGEIVFGTHGYFGSDIPGIQEPILALSMVGQPKGQAVPFE